MRVAVDLASRLAVSLYLNQGGESRRVVQSAARAARAANDLARTRLLSEVDRRLHLIGSAKGSHVDLRV